jgi:hypothetical protein
MLPGRIRRCVESLWVSCGARRVNRSAASMGFVLRCTSAAARLLDTARGSLEHHE